METKRCTRCGETKTLDGFAKNYANSDLHQSWCKSCHSQWVRQRRAENRQKAEREKRSTEA